MHQICMLTNNYGFERVKGYYNWECILYNIKHNLEMASVSFLWCIMDGPIIKGDVGGGACVFNSKWLKTCCEIKKCRQSKVILIPRTETCSGWKGPFVFYAFGQTWYTFVKLLSIKRNTIILRRMLLVFLIFLPLLVLASLHVCSMRKMTYSAL